MPKMFDTRAQQWREMPDNQVQAAYESGNFVFAKGEKIHIQAPDGRFGTIDESELNQAFRAGAIYDTAVARQERADKAEYEGKNAEALLLAIGRGLTLGGSDVLLDKLGVYDEEELQKIEEQNAVLSGVGEVGGLLLPAVFTGGTTAVAGAAAKAGAKKALAVTPAGLAQRSAAAAEKGIAKLLGVEGAAGGSRMLRAVPGMAVAGGVEGALFGAGETFSEELLGRTDKTAEQIVGDIGLAAMLGGGLTTAFAAAPAVVAKAFQSQAKTTYPTGLAKKVADFKDKYTAAMTGVDAEILSKTRDPKFLDDYLGFSEFQDSLSVSTREHIGGLFNAAFGATKSVNAEKYRVFLPKVKPANEASTVSGALDAINAHIKSLEEVIPRLGDDTKKAAARELINAAKTAQKEIFDQVDARLAAYIHTDDSVRAFKARLTDEGNIEVDVRRRNLDPGSPDIFARTPDEFVYKDMTAPRLKKGSPIYDTKVFGEAELGNLLDGVSADIFKIVDQLKIQQGRYGKGLAGYSKLKSFLESSDYFGQAGDMQKAINAPWSELIGTQKDFAREFLKKKKGAKPGDPEFIADANKVNTFVKNLDKTETTQYHRAQMFDQYMEAFDDYLTAAKSVGMNIEEAYPGAIEAAKNLRGKWSEYTSLQAAKKELDHLSRQPGIVSETFATIGGYAFGGLPGALAARYIRNMAAPGDAVRRRIVAHRMKSQINKVIDDYAVSATNRIISNKFDTIDDFLAMRPSKRATLLGLIGAKATGDDEADTAKEMEALASLSGPGALAEKVAQNIRPLEDAPMLRDQITANAIKGAELLQAAAVKNSTLSINPITGQQRVVVSDAGAANYARAQNAVMGPALEQLNREISTGALTDDTVKISRAMYPILYDRFVNKFNETMAKASELGEKISFDAMQMWGKLNGQPVVPTQIASALQAVHKAVEGQQERGTRRSAAALRDLANRSVSVTDRALT